jgi:haloalkane dehalogenase
MSTPPEKRFEALPGYPFSPRFITVGGSARLHYIQEGPASGVPILLLHGHGQWSYLFRRVVPILAEAETRAIAPDLLGSGRSDQPLSAHQNGLEELVQALDIKQVVFCGYAEGAELARAIGAAHPDRCLGVFVIETDPETRAAETAHAILKFCQSKLSH